jgi:hypothetical protein
VIARRLTIDKPVVAGLDRIFHRVIQTSRSMPPSPGSNVRAWVEPCAVAGKLIASAPR